MHIELIGSYSECGDGCCSFYDTEVVIDGKSIGIVSDHVDEIVALVASRLTDKEVMVTESYDDTWEQYANMEE